MELLHRRCCGLDVHKETVVACLRLVSDGKVTTEVRTFQTTTADLLRLSEWLAANECTHVAMEATGVYWKPVWHILDDGEFALVLANAAHVKNLPGRKTDINDATWLAELLAHGLIRASFVPLQQSAAGCKQPISQPGYQEATSFMRTRHRRIDQAMRRQDRFHGSRDGLLFIGREYLPQAHNSRRRLREHPSSVSDDPVARAGRVFRIAQ